MLKTDYDLTGKTYKKLNSFIYSESNIRFEYFRSSIQFRTCKSYKQWLENKHKHDKFKVCFDK